MKRDRLERIMAFADGELEGAERAEVESWLASDDEARAALGDVRLLGDVVRDVDAPPAPPASFVDDLLARLDRESEAAEATAPPVRPAPVVPLASRRKSSGAVVGVVAALALAASVAFVVTSRRAEAPTAVNGVPTAGELAEEPGVEVESVESPSHSVSVFYLPSSASNAASGVVVWVDDDEEHAEPAPEPAAPVPSSSSSSGPDRGGVTP